MTPIVCGTDFSPCAEEAGRVAAGIAGRRGAPLVLAHAGFGAAAIHALDEAAAPLRARCAVEPVLVAPPPADALLDLAAQRGAGLLVVGGVGERHGALKLGSSAEAVCQAARLPVLVVRSPAPLSTWTAGGPPLRVAVLVDEPDPARAVLRWVAGLTDLGALDVTLVHLAWPPAEQARLGVHAPMDLVEPHPDVLAARRAELTGLAEEAGLAAQPVVRVGWGRAADHLVTIAQELGAELIVVGTRRRTALDRLWRGSVTHGVLANATCSVAAVPAA